MRCKREDQRSCVVHSCSLCSSKGNYFINKSALSLASIEFVRQLIHDGAEEVAVPRGRLHLDQRFSADATAAINLGSGRTGGDTGRSDRRCCGQACAAASLALVQVGCLYGAALHLMDRSLREEQSNPQHLVSEQCHLLTSCAVQCWSRASQATQFTFWRELVEVDAPAKCHSRRRHCKWLLQCTARHTNLDWIPPGWRRRCSSWPRGCCTSLQRSTDHPWRP
jgi:hypothetical protein